MKMVPFYSTCFLIEEMIFISETLYKEYDFNVLFQGPQLRNMFLDSTVYIDIGIVFIYFITNPTFQFAAVDVTHDILSWWWCFFFCILKKKCISN